MARDFIDPYTDPHTGVLKNKPGLRSEAALKTFDYEQSAARAVELRAQPIQGGFDLQHLKAIHKHLFQDVYAWAGELREINISKGGSSFTKAGHLEAIADRLADNLRRENHLQGLSKAQFVDRFAHHYAEINALHPFREGNGRATREFIGQLARQAGYELDQTRIDKVKAEWNLAAKLSFQGEIGPIKAVFAEAIRPTRAVAFEKLPEAEALRKHPELISSYDELRAKRLSLAQQHPQNEKAQAHYYAQARGEILRRLDAGQMPAQSIERPRATQHEAKAEAFRTLPPGAGIQRHPDLAPHYAALAAIERKSQTDALPPAVRSEVLARVRTSLAERIERGEPPAPQRGQVHHQPQQRIPDSTRPPELARKHDLDRGA